MNVTGPMSGSWNNPYSNPVSILENQKTSLLNQIQSINSQLQQYSNMNRNTVSMITGKVVGSIEEVQSLPCPADGSGAYYPCPTGKKIFVKQISDDGTIKITVYEPASDKPKQDDIMLALTTMNTKLTNLETNLIGSNSSVNEENKGEMNNESDTAESNEQ